MKKNAHPYPLFTFLLMFLFAFGMQSDLNAQLRVINNSDCNIVIWSGGNETNNNCNPCGVSIPTQVPNNGIPVQINNYDPFVCGADQQWLAVRWYTNQFGQIPGLQAGQSFNPFLVLCGTDTPPTCNNQTQTATWSFLGAFTNGFGPATVTIDN